MDRCEIDRIDEAENLRELQLELEQDSFLGDFDENSILGNVLEQKQSSKGALSNISNVVHNIPPKRIDDTLGADVKSSLMLRNFVGEMIESDVSNPGSSDNIKDAYKSIHEFSELMIAYKSLEIQKNNWELKSKALEVENDRLTHIAFDCQSELADVKEKCHMLETNITDIARSEGVRHFDHSQLEGEVVVNVKRELKQLRDDLKRTQSSSSHATQEAAAEVMKVQADNETLRGQLGLLEGLLSQRTVLHQAQNRDWTQEKNERDHLFTTQSSQLSSLHTQVHDLSTTLRDTEKRCDELDGERGRLDQVVGSLSSQVEEQASFVRKSERNLEASQQRVLQLQKEVDILKTSDIEDIQKSMARESQNVQEKMNETILELRGELDEERNQKGKMEESFHQQENELSYWKNIAESGKSLLSSQILGGSNTSTMMSPDSLHPIIQPQDQEDNPFLRYLTPSSNSLTSSNATQTASTIHPPNMMMSTIVERGSLDHEEESFSEEDLVEPIQTTTITNTTAYQPPSSPTKHQSEQSQQPDQNDEILLQVIEERDSLVKKVEELNSYIVSLESDYKEDVDNLNKEWRQVMAKFRVDIEMERDSFIDTSMKDSLKTHKKELKALCRLWEKWILYFVDYLSKSLLQLQQTQNNKNEEEVSQFLSLDDLPPKSASRISEPVLNYVNRQNVVVMEMFEESKTVETTTNEEIEESDQKIQSISTSPPPETTSIETQTTPLPPPEIIKEEGKNQETQTDPSQPNEEEDEENGMNNVEIQVDLLPTLNDQLEEIEEEIEEEEEEIEEEISSVVDLSQMKSILLEVQDIKSNLEEISQSAEKSLEIEKSNLQNEISSIHSTFQNFIHKQKVKYSEILSLKEQEWKLDLVEREEFLKTKYDEQMDELREELEDQELISKV